MDWASRLARLVSVSASSGGGKSCPTPSVAASMGASLAGGLEPFFLVRVLALFFRSRVRLL
jgi:hypothetical protein